MGGKTTTTEVKVPNQTPEQRTAYKDFTNLLNAQLSQDYIITEHHAVAKNPDDTLTPYTYNTYALKPAVAARLKANQAATDKINKQFYAVADKVLRGDLSTTSQQKAQIKSMMTRYFDPVMNVLTAQYSNAEKAVNSAVDRLMGAGKAEVQYAVGEQAKGQKKSAETLGRSFSDMSFQRNMNEFTGGALERLYASGASSAASAIAQLRGEEASAIGNVAMNRGLAGYQAEMAQANPLASFGAGSQFAALQSNIGSQQQANAYRPISSYLDFMGQQNQVQMAQPTTTTTKPFGVLDILGALAGAGAAGLSGAASAGVFK